MLWEAGLDSEKAKELRRLVTETIRVEGGQLVQVDFVDPKGVVDVATSRRNQVIMGRRGTGKSLLLRHVARRLPKGTQVAYVDCEELKHHTLPNVLIDILDVVFRELLSRSRWAWVPGTAHWRLNRTIKAARAALHRLRTKDDQVLADIKHSSMSSVTGTKSAELGATYSIFGGKYGASKSTQNQTQTEATYKIRWSKISGLNDEFTILKQDLEEAIRLRPGTDTVFIQLDDFYHLRPTDQPFVIDFIHRLCKNLPCFFKVATLPHASALYLSVDGQPVGVQKLHDYQVINVDYSLEEFGTTRDQIEKIFFNVARIAEVAEDDVRTFFRGGGFDRLIIAGGGVPRDCLAILAELLQNATVDSAFSVGKDDVRKISPQILSSRIDDLKRDSAVAIQDDLLRAIYALREVALNQKRANVFVVDLQHLREGGELEFLVQKLIDYRIIHLISTNLTHKSVEGTFNAYAIDIGFYAHMRKLAQRLTETDIAANNAKEKYRSAPRLTSDDLVPLVKSAPDDLIDAILVEEEDEDPE